MHKKRSFSYFLILGFLSFYSCSKSDLEVDPPTYIVIEDIKLTADQATQGSDAENITDAWVFINDNLVGVYELPAKFPVVEKGSVNVKIFAGVKENTFVV